MNAILLTAVVVAGGDLRDADEFERTHGGPDQDRGVHVTATRDGGYAAVGVTKSSGAGGEDVLLVRTDAAGEVLWSTTYGGAADDMGWYVLEAAEGFVLAGSSASSGAGGFDFYLVKTDARGKELWSRTFGGAKDDRCWALAPTADGGFVLVGETASTGAGERDGYLVRTDAEGEELWARTFGGEKDDRLFSVAVLEGGDGGFVLAGQTFSEGAGDRDAYVVGTDAEGAPRWAKTFGGEASDVAHSVCATSGGSFFVTGYTTSFASEGTDPYLLLIDAAGELEWESVLPLPGVSRTITGEEAAGGGFFCVGITPDPAYGRGRALLVKADEDGRLEWHRSFFSGAGGDSMAYTVRATEDGGCVFTGHGPGADGSMDLILVKAGNGER
jgi:hypothetical protein